MRFEIGKWYVDSERPEIGYQIIAELDSERVVAIAPNAGVPFSTELVQADAYLHTEVHPFDVTLVVAVVDGRPSAFFTAAPEGAKVVHVHALKLYVPTGALAGALPSRPGGEVASDAVAGP